MTHALAIDFGTTNSVVARWNPAANHSEMIALPDLSRRRGAPLVPSLVYINNGQAPAVTVGEMVREAGLDFQHDQRLFRNFKRGIVDTSAPAPRLIDQNLWGDRDAAEQFLQQLFTAVAQQVPTVSQLVLTTPVGAFETYLAWLGQVAQALPIDEVRVVDESTAAALGYAVTQPGALALVFDFGGGTLDLSLVQLPKSKARTGGWLKKLLNNHEAGDYAAKVIAKAGHMLGGSDIDRWLMDEVLARVGLTSNQLGDDLAPLLSHCEQAKIELSITTETTLHFTAAGVAYTVKLTRAALENILHAQGLFVTLRHVMDSLLHHARRQNVYREDVEHVFLVGGGTLMPAMQNFLANYFPSDVIHADKPFTAIAEGALQVAQGGGLDDYLLHSYVLRYLDPATGQHHFDEILPPGTPYPTKKSVEVALGAAHPNQRQVEFAIGEINSNALRDITVTQQDGQPVFVAQTEAHHVDLLNADTLNQTLATLKPAGQPGATRLTAAFSVDANRQLHLTVTDAVARQVLLADVVVANLR